MCVDESGDPENHPIKIMNMVLLENKKTPVQKPRILLRLDKNKRFKPSRLIFLADFVFSVENLCGLPDQW